MFGDKQARLERLARIAEFIERRPQVTQSEIARQLGIPLPTIHRDLPTLEESGILLMEDGAGRLSLFKRR